MQKFDQKGISLVELMVAISVTSMISIGVALFMSNQNQTVADLKLSMTMRQIYQNIEKHINNPNSIMASALLSDQNAELFNCISSKSFVDPSTGIKDHSFTPKYCIQTNSTIHKPIQFFRAPNSWKNLSAKDIDKLRLAGTIAYNNAIEDPVYYSNKGVKDCDPKDRNCVFKAYAYFWAVCPPDLTAFSNAISDSAPPPPPPSKCLTANAIAIRVQVVHDYLPGQRLIKRKLPSIPDDDVFFWIDEASGNKRLSALFAFTTDVATIPLMQSHSYSCPTNETLISVKDGDPVCRCLPPKKVQVDGTGNKICINERQECDPENQRLRGYTQCGDPICQNVQCGPLKPSPISVNGFAFECDQDRNDQWLEKISLGVMKGAQVGLGDYENTETTCGVNFCSVGKNGGMCELAFKCIATYRCCSETGEPPIVPPCQLNGDFEVLL